MTDQQRIDGFKAALNAASERFGVQIAIVQQIGAVVLDQPALGYVLLTDPAPELPSIHSDVPPSLNGIA